MRNSERVVKKRLADGSTKTYRYAAKPKRHRFGDETIGALILAYKASQEWHALAPASRATYTIYLRVLEAAPHTRVADVTRRDILALRDAVAARGIGAANGFLRAASALFGWAVDREWIDNTPMARVRSLAGGSLPAWTDEQARHLTIYGVNQNEDGTYSWKFDNHAGGGVGGLSHSDQHRLWGQITAPVLLVRGAESWASDPVIDGRIQHFTNARLVNFEGAGHWVHHDRLEAFMAEVETFLAE